jgi:tyrosyl-tRNA synthetase
MSKSLGNYVGVTEAPAEMFGKLMSISDDLMWKYYTLLTDLGPAEIVALRKRVEGGDLHPKQAKVDLAKRIVADFHNVADAARAAEEFERRFAKKEIALESLESLEWRVTEEPRAWRHLLIDLKIASSGREADQKLKQGAVKLNGRRISDQFQIIDLSRGTDYVLEIGRKAYKLRAV